MLHLGQQVHSALPIAQGELALPLPLPLPLPQVLGIKWMQATDDESLRDCAGCTAHISVTVS